MTDVDNNPFNGEREPTNEELLAQWRNFLLICPLAFLFLAMEAYGLGQGWAGTVLPHGVVAWFCLALLTWWRQALMAVLLTFLCLFRAGQAFVETWRQHWTLF